jgi:hypothetical protein
MRKNSLTHLAALLGLTLLIVACSDSKPETESKFKPIPEKKSQAKGDPDTFDRRVQAVMNEGSQSQEGQAEAPKASKARPPNSGKEPMVLLDTQNRPLGEVVHHKDKMDYYECKGIIAPWFQELLVAEMNYFNELADLPFVRSENCIVTYGTDKSLTPGRIGVQLFETRKEFDKCVRNDFCPIFRTVNFVPVNKSLMRSYFLSNTNSKEIFQHCVTDIGKWHRNSTCYTID